MTPALLLLLATQPAPEVLDLALSAFDRAKARGEVHKELITVIDYSLPSTAKRLWVIDPRDRRVLFEELVAHGKRSGDNYARRFSNEPGSLASSLGAFVTTGTYHGKHGYSLALRGLEPGTNDRAEARAIVIHAADYVNAELAARQGRLGRSWGCPALRPEIASRVIDTIKGGSFVFAYYPDPDWERRSPYLHGGTPRRAAR